MKKHPNICIIEGTKPFLLSAPHASPILKRSNDEEYIRAQEDRTEEVVKRICEKTGAWGIFTTTDDIIENWDSYLHKKYRLLVRSIVDMQGISLFLDIHGMRSSRPFLVDYDFIIAPPLAPHPHDDAMHAIIKSQLGKKIPAHKVSNGFFRSLKRPGMRTLTYHVRKNCAIPAVQFELNRTLRMNDKLLADFINSLCFIIINYENTFTGVRSEGKN